MSRAQTACRRGFWAEILSPVAIFLLLGGLGLVLVPMLSPFCRSPRPPPPPTERETPSVSAGERLPFRVHPKEPLTPRLVFYLFAGLIHLGLLGLPLLTIALAGSHESFGKRLFLLFFG